MVLPRPLAALALLVLATPTLAAQLQDYATVVPASARTDPGLFDVHRVGESLLFEIPDSILGRDMIIMSRYAKAQDGLADGGANMAPNIVVRWERRDNRIVLRGVNHGRYAEEGTPLALAVENSNFSPVLHAVPIRARGAATSVVDVTDLYLGDHPVFSMPRQRRTQLQVRAHDRNRTWLEWARSFPINVEIRVVRTYAADQAPSTGRGGAVSFEVNHSMILLPAEPMMPRLADERVTYITTGRFDYSSAFQGVRQQQYLRRFRMEPSDPAAWARGELVEPKNPWIWYIDPATPPEWVPYFIAGVEEWQSAFELAGFRNAIQARLAPTEDEDPEFSLLDARYSVIRYVVSPVRSANSGGDVVDPRSGEVLRAHTNMYHGLMERLRWWILAQLAAANPNMQTNQLSLADMGEALRYVVSHETAHSVGLPHNQRANFVYPVDSIRDPDFVARMGHSASSVGRTRYNYAAQPGDGVAPERRIGLWDKFAVMWGYRPIPGATTPEAERDTLDRWITERAHLPWFRSAEALFGMDVEWDPYRMTEGISDDPVAAATLGMNNLRTTAANLLDWVVKPHDDYYELETHHLQLLTQWNRYAQHASAAVGGFWTHHKRVNEPGPVYTAIDAAYQRRAMRFLDEQVLSTPAWALDADVLRRIEHAGVVERVRAYQVMAVERLMNPARLARLIEQEAFLGSAAYRPSQMLDDTREIVWREVRQNRAIDTYRRNLQRGYLDHAHQLLHATEFGSWSPPNSGDLRVGNNNDPPLNGPLHLGQSDIRPLIRDQLGALRREIQAALSRGVVDRMTRIHLEDALVRIGRAIGA